jgi:hypothetical protein
MRDETSIRSMITWDDEDIQSFTESTMHDSKNETNDRLDQEAIHIKPTVSRYEDPDADVGLDGYFVDAAISHRDEFGVTITIHNRSGFLRTNLSRSQAEQMRDAINKILGV